jgi:hypothetical protein
MKREKKVRNGMFNQMETLLWLMKSLMEVKIAVSKFLKLKAMDLILKMFRID